MKVPTPGPYSTNSLVFAQSTGSSILSMSTRLDGMIEPTITGFLMKPRRNCHCGLGERRSRRRWRRRGLFSVRAEEVGMKAPCRGERGRSVGKCAAAWQGSERTNGQRSASLRRRQYCDEEVPLRCALCLCLPRGFDRAQPGRRLDGADHHVISCCFIRRCWSPSSGNTALQSVMPAIGREIGIDDFYVAIAYTWSAVLWVAARALLGGEERPPRPQDADDHGRQRLHRVDDPVRDRAVLRASTAGSAAR